MTTISVARQKQLMGYCFRYCVDHNLTPTAGANAIYGVNTQADRALIRLVQGHERGYHGNASIGVDGTFNTATQALLDSRYGPTPPTPSLRDEVKRAALWLQANFQGTLGYSQGDTRSYICRQKWQQPSPTDCSMFATGCYAWAGAPDPNGFNYNGFGFTGSLAVQGEVVSLTRSLPGDLAFYGSGTYQHVTVIVGEGGELCVSHGSSVGPLLLTPRYRPDLAVVRSYLPR